MRFLLYTALLSSFAFAQNQTDTVTPVISEDSLPFTLRIEEAPFSLPTALQTYCKATYNGKWVLIAGRTNGLHSFLNVGNNFPPLFQNTTVFVIDPQSGLASSRDLSTSDLTQFQIDTLSVTAGQFFQKGGTLYIVGGYGINTATGLMGTMNTLSAINLEGLMQWVSGAKPTLKSFIRQVAHPLLQVTGGNLVQDNDHTPFLLTFGQNFDGLYLPGSNGNYTQQVRQFWLVDEGKTLRILPNNSTTTSPDYRRRDLNIVPILSDNKQAYLALSGVFTLTKGIWTVPVTISPEGESFQPDPLHPNTFKQAMNQYICPTFGLYSTKTQEMFIVLPGGLSYGFFSGGVFQTNDKVPFVNQVTTIRIKNNNYSQHLMNSEYPVIYSTGSNPGNQLLFGASSRFFLNEAVATYRNGVIQLDTIKTPTVVGYIVGGIMSTLPSTFSPTDTTASPYIFEVTIVPKVPSI